MRLRRVLPPLLLCIAACGSNNQDTSDAAATPDAPATPDAARPDATPPTPDATADAATDAAITPDAPPDAASVPVASTLVVLDGTTAITEWSFADTAVGTRAQATLFVSNAGNATTAPLATSFVGTAAGDVAIDSARSNCDGATLLPGDQCRVTLIFVPSAIGARTAVLHVTGAPIALDFPLTGNALAAPAGLTADVSALDFGEVELGQPTDLSVALTNAGNTDLTITAPTVTSGFAIAVNECTGTLAPSASCSIRLEIQPSQGGVVTGSLTVPSSGTAVTIGLRALAERRITITRSGAGTGTITSLPGGINCGTDCTGLFLGPVTLSVAPDPGFVFTGWSQLCGGASSCTVPGDGPSVQLAADFQSATAKRLDITFAGTGRGFVYLTHTHSAQKLTMCTASCTLFVEPSDPEELTLWGFTPSQFAGWTAGCSSTTANDCDLGRVTSDRAATVTFNRDAQEVATIFPPKRLVGLAMTPDGNLVTATTTEVSKLNLAGDVLWTTPMTAELTSPEDGGNALTTDAAGNVYGSGGGGLYKLSPDGQIVWTRPVAILLNGDASFQSVVSASLDGTVIAARTARGAHVVDGDGQLRFDTGKRPDGMAVAPDGTVAVGVDNPSVPGVETAQRFDKTGHELESVGDFDPGISLIYDPQGFLSTLTTHFGATHMVRYSPALQPAGANREDTGFPGAVQAGLAVDPSGNTAIARGESDGHFGALGLRVRVIAPDSSVLWEERKPANDLGGGAPILIDGVTPFVIAGDGNTRFAIGGLYSDDTPWIRISTFLPSSTLTRGQRHPSTLRDR